MTADEARSSMPAGARLVSMSYHTDGCVAQYTYVRAGGGFVAFGLLCSHPKEAK